jgi:hypothetical protein
MDTSNSDPRSSIPSQQVPSLSFDQYLRTNYGVDVHLSPSTTLDLISNKRERRRMMALSITSVDADELLWQAIATSAPFSASLVPCFATLASFSRSSGVAP